MGTHNRSISVLHHILIFCSYAGLAAAAALYGPLWLPELGPERAIALAAAVFFGGALGHEIYARFGREVVFGEELLNLRRRQGAMQEELSWNRRQMMALREILESAAENGPPSKSRKSVDDVIAEVKVLQSLVTRLSKAQKKPSASAKSAKAKDPAATIAAAETPTVPALNLSETSAVGASTGESATGKSATGKSVAVETVPDAALATLPDRPFAQTLGSKTPQSSETAVTSGRAAPPPAPEPVLPEAVPPSAYAAPKIRVQPPVTDATDWQAIGAAVDKRRAESGMTRRPQPDTDLNQGAPQRDGSERPATERAVEDHGTAANTQPAQPEKVQPAQPEKVQPAQPEKVLPPVLKDLSEDEIVDVAREALQADRVDVLLQPIVTLPQRKRCFYECFTRLRTDDGFMVLPEQYIALAEREGLVAAIDDMLLFRCIQLVRKIQSRGESFDFFCNISRHTLINDDFFTDFVEFLASNAELTRNLVFEFTQADFNAWDEGVARKLDRLARLGCRFSLDGVVSLEVDLKALAAHEIRFVKVDSLLLLADPESSAALAHDLKQLQIDLIAEKVETEEALVEVLDLGVNYAQGYLFSEPRLARPAA